MRVGEMYRPLPEGLDLDELREMQVPVGTVHRGQGFVLIRFPPPEPDHWYHRTRDGYLKGRVARQYDGATLVEVGKPGTRTIEKADGSTTTIQMTRKEKVTWSRAVTVVPEDDFRWAVQHAD